MLASYLISIAGHAVEPRRNRTVPKLTAGSIEKAQLD